MLEEDKKLKPCPFCGCEMSIKSNRDWHYLRGLHKDSCILLDTLETNAPATDIDLLVLISEWNGRVEEDRLLTELALVQSIADANVDSTNQLLKLNKEFEEYKGTAGCKRLKGQDVSFTCSQGNKNSPKPENCYVWKANPDIITLYCDMDKRCFVTCTGTGGNEPPQIHVSSDDDDIENYSVIHLTDFVGWDIFSAQISKDILAICLIREEKYVESN